ncbi:MAG: MASE1 domain-containing protein [Proteobacteria bacterium]|nr:MASE1 domain-containing protein [Pseudomonadota bacterium]
MALPRVFDAPKIVIGVTYLAAYALLDWLSFIEPYAQLSISPWNPGIGLTFVLLLMFGRRMIPFAVAAPLLADILQRQYSLPWTFEVLSSVLVGAGYSLAALVLLRPRLRFDPALSSMRDLLLLMLVAAISAAGVALAYVGLMVASGFLPPADFSAAAMRNWIGDVIGIIVVAPFALLGLTRPRLIRLSTETMLQLAAIVVALIVVFGVVEEQQFQLFYVLFLPVVWMAVRTGLEGVSAGILVTQLGLIVGIHLFPAGTFNVTSFQALMLVLAMTGLVSGELVTERRRTQSQLQRQQEQLARVARLGSMGELAAAVAHELNQPLTAAGTYTRLVDEAINAGNTDPKMVAETAKKAVAQVERAAEVVRRLRALVRLDRSNRASWKLERAIKDTVELCQADLDRHHVTLRSSIPSDLPSVMIDLIQIEQVLINLVRNAIEVLGDGKSGRGVIAIDAAAADSDFVEVRVTDTGPGFSSRILENDFMPLGSSKAEGLGIGLSLCKSIIEAHGGLLKLEGGAQGAVVRFTLPIAKTG